MRRIVLAALLGLLSLSMWSGSAFAVASDRPLVTVVAQDPGPSAALFAAPYYKCQTNYYVATTGSDSNAGTSAAPWATLSHADTTLHTAGPAAAAGACVNVAPGSYAGVQLTASGNLASATGYLVWRCTTMDACTVNTTAGINGNAGFMSSNAAGSADYVMIDGFTIPGTGAVYNVGIEITGHTNGQVGLFGSHHVWVLNSVIYGNGQGGVAFAESDYTYAIHNKIYGNANASSCDNGAQGSGLANNVPLDITAGVPGYVATADDKTNPNPLIGSFVVGSTWFHNVYEWNVVYNNHLTPCTATGGDTDGNNIILDTFGTGNGNSVAYPDQTLIGFNVVYNAGGGGIHIFYSEYATVANNTCYNNGLDPYEGGTAGGAACIDTNDSYANTILNNIAVAVPNAPPAGGCSFTGTVPGAPTFNPAILGGLLVGSPADTFSNNVSQLQGGNNSCWGSFGNDSPTGENPMWNGDVFSTTSNKTATNPLWVSVGGTSTGTMSTPPNGVNFALQSTSPAIGYGLTETYLPATSVDAGACYHTLASCP
jgi:parallel beta-helix repeat protein